MPFRQTFGGATELPERLVELQVRATITGGQIRYVAADQSVTAGISGGVDGAG